MKKRLTISIFLLTFSALHAQERTVQDIQTDAYYEKNRLYRRTFLDTVNKKSNQVARENFRQTRKNLFLNSKNDYGNVNTAANELMNLIYEIEMRTLDANTISPDTRALITSIQEPYLLIQLERSIKENMNEPLIDDNNHYQFKEKILNAISYELSLKMKNTLPYYSYALKKKKLLKFVSIRTGNDLFTPAGLIGQAYPDRYYVPDNLPYFQRNDDRDYTGSFLIEVGTDYLNTLRRRPIKSYQTFLYGFDVYTPYFRNKTIFENDTSYNPYDRPHASFQYFGWSKKCLSKFGKFRWETTVKFGRIGGKTGENFQNVLHQDVSYSPRPKGWGAQIARGGRLGISFEAKQEYQWYLVVRDPNSFLNLNLSAFSEEKVGTYMTTAGLGIQLDNKKFTQTNQNFINLRTRQGVKSFLDHVYYRVGFGATYVVHNTMLEGYGIFSTSESKNDVLTPRSSYYLKHNQVRRLTGVLNVTLSYTTRFATLFYNWKSYSPETYLAGIGILSYSGKEMNISKRWHHFAEIGLTFNIH